MKDINHKHRSALLLILMMIGWLAGPTAWAQKIVNVVPNSDNLWTDIDEEGEEYPNALIVEDGEEYAYFALSKDKGSQVPAYDGSALILYKGNKISLENLYSQNISKIEFQTAEYKNAENTLSAASGNVEYNADRLTYTWNNTDSVSSVDFTIATTQMNIQSVKIFYGISTGNPTSLVAPNFSQGSCYFYKSFNLTLTDLNSPTASIRYTMDGSEPTATNGTLYTVPITIPEGSDVTVKAVAYNDEATSAVASATYQFQRKYQIAFVAKNKSSLSRIYYDAGGDYGEYNGKGGTGYVLSGENVRVRVYTNTDYTCNAVTMNGEPLELSGRYYTFTMPDKDVTVEIDARYNPASPSDPSPTEPDTTKYYTLTIVSNPVSASNSNSVKKYKAGDEVYVSAYANNGYKFTGWTKDADTINTNRSFYYTMPAADVVLVGNYVYNPSSPSDPTQPTLKHPVTAIASPSGSATFYISNSQVKFGDTYSVQANPATGYQFKRWILNGVAQDVESNVFEGVMTDDGASLVAIMEYNPSSPDNPGANYYNPSTGQLIIDDFTMNNLNNAIYKAVGSSDYSNVSSIIVKGKIGKYDYNCLRNLSNVQTIDLSRTGGDIAISDYGFQNSVAANILLSAATKSIGSRAFSGCENLSSITCYAQEPPTCTSYSFYNFTNKDNCTIYVPASAIELYSNAEGWKDFTILPITDDAHVMQVNLPAEASDGKYKHYTLEIVNINSAVRQKYVVSDRLLYTFNGLQKDEQYNIYMYSPSGLEVGRVENVVIPDHDFEVAFSTLKSLYVVNAKVVDDKGNDVTSQTTIEWLRPLADGTITYLRKATSMGEIPDGQQLICRATIDEQLGLVYAMPSDTEFTIDADHNSCTIQLVPLRSVTLKGSVVDGDGTALSGASVSISQTINGRYQKSNNVKTDRTGQWTAQVVEAPETRIIYAATECVNVNDTIGAFADDVAEMDLGKTTLKSIIGARVNYTFTYQAAGSETISDYYTDYQNVAISVFNITQNRAHKEVSVQYPLLAILDENVQTGDMLQLVATSKTGAFEAITDTVTIGDNQRAETVFNIVGKGGIEASYKSTDNPTVIAMLYSASGELIKKTTYSDATATFAELESGNYTLVTMGQTDMMNSILRLSNFDEIGLTAGKDYLKNMVTVERGKLAEVALTEVPAFDESLFYYTNSNTSFSTNKSSITTGGYLTLRSVIDFKGAYKSNITNVALVVDLPEACDFVEKSLIQGPNLLPYTLDNHRLTIQLGNNYQTQTRFCVIPTSGGSFNATASVVFDYNGRTITQPIGSAASEIKDLEISVPSVTASADFKVTGTALANSEVVIIENGVVIGSGKANGAGSWNVKCELPEPYNLSTHDVYAQITTEKGNTLTSETKQITYDVNAVQVAKVVMYHFNPEMNKTYTSEFDFQNPKTSATQWTVYYPKKVFTYTIEFTDNNPERISNVVLYVHTADGKIVPCAATYNKQKQLWYADIDMGNSSNGYYPVNCSVDFDYHKQTAKFDKRAVDDVVTTDGSFFDSYTSLIDNLSKIDVATMTDEQWKEFYAANNLSYDEAEGDIQFPTDYDNWTDDKKAEYLAALASEMEAEMDSISEQIAQLKDLFVKNGNTASMQFGDGSTLSVKTCDGITAEQLISQGFTAVDNTDGTKVYILTNEDRRVYVDLTSNLYVETTGASIQTLSLADDLVSTFRKMKEAYNNWNDTNIGLCINILKEIHGTLENAKVGFSRLITSGEEDMMAKVESWLSKLERQQRRYRQLVSKAPNSAIASIYRTKLNDVVAKKSMALGFKACVKPAFKLLAKSLPVTDWIAITVDLINKATDIKDIYTLIDSKTCLTAAQRDDFIAQNRLLLTRVGLYASGSIIPTAIGDAEIFAGIWGTLETGGVSLGVSALGYVMKSVAQISTLILDNMLSNDIRTLRDSVNAVKCPNESLISNRQPHTGGAYKSGSVDDNVQIDPSGYVYEAVPTNRVEGVQASIYYKETKEDIYGDPYEEIVLWNAEDYAQKNPLFTDENGMYRWDVPQGLWQVKFEKDGYQTAYSEWLPVPPPQLEVNIGIKQNKQPEITEARAYEEGIEVQFDKFMDLTTLTADNIYVTANNTKLAGEIRFVDATLADEFASADDADALSYASRIRFVPEQKLANTTGEIRLTVSRNVKSYAGIPMTQTYSQVLDVEKEVQAITADNVKVLYGGEKTITIFATPFEAAAGKTLHIANSSDLIASIDNTEATIDAEGKAVVKVKGDLPGTTQLTYTIDNVSVSGQSSIDVVTEIITAEAPTASRATGTAVYRGTKIELTTESKNATIYFTTDGSCPCDENGTRRKYTVPIVINGDTKIIAMTAVGNGDEEVSNTVEFSYTLKQSDMEFQMPQGWTWISHNFDTDIEPTALATDAGVSRILSQTQELVRDPQLGLVGTLSALTASQSYKVEASAATARLRLSDYAWNPATPIALSAGWNWLGYPVAQTMTLDEAFASTQAERLDVVVGQMGFAQFDGEHWIGTLETMSPGLGYMYQSVSDKNVVYNTAIVSDAAAKSVAGINAAAPLVVDIHKYAKIMPMVATLCDANGLDIDNSDYQVAAFCGSECRGVGKLVSGLVMMNIYGETGDNITFSISDKDGDNSYQCNNALSFAEEVVGNIFSPYSLQMGNTTGIGSAGYDGNVRVAIVGNWLTIKGIASGDVKSVEIFDINGQKMLYTSRISDNGVDITSIADGVYVVVVNAGGSYTYHKIAIR